MSESSSNMCSSFFKVLKGDFSDNLRIPLAFVKQTPMDLSKKAKLKGPSGRIWLVGLSRKVNGIYLQDDWKKFAEDHLLEDSHFLLFRYYGNMHFTVHIFDKTACEIIETASFKTFQESLPHHCKDQSSSSFSSTRQQESIYPQYGDGMNCLNKSKSEIHKCKNIETDDHKLSISEYTLIDDDCCIIEVKGPSSETKETKAIAFAKASKFPTFLNHFKSDVNKYTFWVPLKFCEEHMPYAKKTIFLKDPNGRAWKMNFVKYLAGGLLSRGWRAFSLANNLGMGDVCVFELVGECQIQVHIYKENSIQILQ